MMTIPQPTGRSPARVLRLALALLTVHGLLFVLSEFSGPAADKADWQNTFDAFAFFPLQAGSFVALLVASRRVDLDPRTRRGLRLLAFAFTAFMLGSAVWFTMHLLGQPLAWRSWADLIYLPFYPFLVLGLFALPTADRARDRVQDLLSFAIVLLAFAMLIAFATSIDYEVQSLSLATQGIVLVTSAAQLVSLMAINRAVERAQRTPSITAMDILLFALALSVMGDLLLQILYSGGFNGTRWATTAAIATNLLIVYSAVRFIEDPISEIEASRDPEVSFSPLPIISVSILAVVIVWLSSRGFVTGSAGLMIGLVSLNLMLVAREVMTSREAAAAMALGAQREANRRLEALVRHASDTIVLLDVNGGLVFASEPADQLFGLSSLARGSDLRLEKLLPAGEREAWREFVARIKSSPNAPVTHTWRLERPSGEARLIETVGLDLRSEPAVRGVVLNFRDVTDRSVLEERLRQAQKLEVAGRLAGGVAHDFNNVLTAMIAGTELAQMSLDPDHPAQEDLRSIEAAAQRGAALTRRLLAFVRQDPVPAQLFDLGPMLKELDPLLARLVGESHSVEIENPTDECDVLVDRTELEHIIFNLVANARDAMPHGGPISIEVKRIRLEAVEPPDGFVILPPPGEYARIVVSDRGHGMSGEVRRRMFDPFYTQKSGGRGTGLGLIGVRPLVDGARGGLRVESSPEDGTRVALFLPLRSAFAPCVVPATRVGGPPRRTPDSQPAVRPEEKVCVLLVEDELQVREQVTRLIEALGYSCIAVAGASDARAALSRGASRVRAIVSDVMMPDETGIEFADWLRKEHPSLPILLISGHTGSALDREARMTTDMTLLRKPFTSNELSEHLARMMPVTSR